MAVTVVETSIGDRDLLVAGSGGTANACAVKCGQVPRQRGSAPASRPGLQSRQLHADKGDTRDRYKRLIAVCYIGSLNINEQMVVDGWALAYRKYSKDYVKDIIYTKSTHEMYPFT